MGSRDLRSGHRAPNERTARLAIRRDKATLREIRKISTIMAGRVR